MDVYGESWQWIEGDNQITRPRENPRFGDIPVSDTRKNKVNSRGLNCYINHFPILDSLNLRK
jgi:hypothetical protein